MFVFENWPYGAGIRNVTNVACNNVPAVSLQETFYDSREMTSLDLVNTTTYV